MIKYQELSELYENMSQERINKRPQSCQHILDDKQNCFIFEVKRKKFQEIVKRVLRKLPPNV